MGFFNRLNTIKVRIIMKMHVSIKPGNEGVKNHTFLLKYVLSMVSMLSIIAINEYLLHIIAMNINILDECNHKTKSFEFCHLAFCVSLVLFAQFIL